MSLLDAQQFQAFEEVTIECSICHEQAALNSTELWITLGAICLSCIREYDLQNPEEELAE